MLNNTFNTLVGIFKIKFPISLTNDDIAIGILSLLSSLLNNSIQEAQIYCHAIVDVLDLGL